MFLWHWTNFQRLEEIWYIQILRGNRGISPNWRKRYANGQGEIPPALLQKETPKTGNEIAQVSCFRRETTNPEDVCTVGTLATRQLSATTSLTRPNASRHWRRSCVSIVPWEPTVHRNAQVRRPAINVTNVITPPSVTKHRRETMEGMQCWQPVGAARECFLS